MLNQKFSDLFDPRSYVDPELAAFGANRTLREVVEQLPTGGDLAELMKALRNNWLITGQRTWANGLDGVIPQIAKDADVRSAYEEWRFIGYLELAMRFHLDAAEQGYQESVHAIYVAFEKLTGTRCAALRRLLIQYIEEISDAQENRE